MKANKCSCSVFLVFHCCFFNSFVQIIIAQLQFLQGRNFLERILFKHLVLCILLQMVFLTCDRCVEFHAQVRILQGYLHARGEKKF